VVGYHAEPDESFENSASITTLMFFSFSEMTGEHIHVKSIFWFLVDLKSEKKRQFSHVSTAHMRLHYG